MLEYLALRDGKEKELRERFELIRWEKFLDARLDVFRKKKPSSPEEIATFAWEKKKPEEVILSNVTDAEAEALTNIFKQANF